MKRAISLLLCVLILYTGVVRARASEDGPQIAAKAHALIDARSGRVLSSSEGGVRLPMASTTKIMTALLVLENTTLTDVVQIGKVASGVEGSSMYLEVGERQTVESLLLGLMLRSGNDAAVALAVHVSGSVEEFVALMNERARQMGLKDTQFRNPHGLPAEGHYTTALELCAIMAQALTHDEFVRIIGTRRAQVPWDGHPWDRVMTNKNRLLEELEGCVGGKTGYIDASGRCLVMAAERDGMRLVGVVLNCPDWWNQMAALLEWGFARFDAHVFLELGESAHTLNTGGKPSRVDAVAAEMLALPVSQGEELALRIEILAMPKPPYVAGQPLGVALAVVDGEELASVRLVAAQDVVGNRFGDAVGRILALWVGG